MDLRPMSMARASWRNCHLEEPGKDEWHFQGGDEASQAEKRCRGGRAAAPVLEGDWQENPTAIP